jgi:hypothetical protein
MVCPNAITCEAHNLPVIPLARKDKFSAGAAKTALDCHKRICHSVNIHSIKERHWCDFRVEGFKTGGPAVRLPQKNGMLYHE